MDTRSLTVFIDDKKEIAALYRQMDGYHQGHGAELKAAFGECMIVNGYNPGQADQIGKIANGMDCLAAQVVAHFKKQLGNFYLMPAGTRDVGEEFIYAIYCRAERGPLQLKLHAGAVTYFGMPGTKQHHMPILYDGALSAFDPDAAAMKYKKICNAIPNDYLKAKAGVQWN